jgi:uncharacterized damage-inducible protein DinB
LTSASDVLRAAFDRHSWATLGLIDAIEDLDPSQLDAAIEGTYGSILQTLTHLVDADERYLNRFDDPSLPSGPGHRTEPLDRLRARVVANAGRWVEMLDRLDAGTLDAQIVGKSDHPDTSHAEGMLMVQALHHGDDHRAQICSTLGALGSDVPDLDGWAYWAAEHAGG